MPGLSQFIDRVVQFREVFVSSFFPQKFYCCPRLAHNILTHVLADFLNFFLSHLFQTFQGSLAGTIVCLHLFFSFFFKSYTSCLLLSSTLFSALFLEQGKLYCNQVWQTRQSRKGRKTLFSLLSQARQTERDSIETKVRGFLKAKVSQQKSTQGG